MSREPAGLNDARPASGARVSSPRLRAAKIEDLAQIMDIERSCFSSPWPEVAMADEIGGRSWSRVVVAEVRYQLVGFMVYWDVDGELHLLNLAILPDARRRGIARSMVEWMLGDAERGGSEEIWLEVRRTNTAARQLYGRMGFADFGIRPHYYQDNDEDAIVMRWQLPRGDE